MNYKVEPYENGFIVKDKSGKQYGFCESLSSAQFICDALNKLYPPKKEIKTFHKGVRVN